MRKHDTDVEKFIRASWYRCLRAHGLSEDAARKCRDWTDNKIKMIILGTAKPVF